MPKVTIDISDELAADLKKYAAQNNIDYQTWTQGYVEHAINEFMDPGLDGSRHQVDCAWEAAHILFLACNADCTKAKAIYTEWKKTKDAQEHGIRAFVASIPDALQQIEDGLWHGLTPKK